MDDVVDDAGSVVDDLCSFGGETGVLMADGTTKPISEVEVGDVVLARTPRPARSEPGGSRLRGCTTTTSFG